MPKITIFVPDEEPIKFGFEEQAEVNIGRSADNDIILTHHSISGHHAQLRKHGDQWLIADLGSTNGTFLDGAPAENTVLVPGAQITLGQVPASFEDENAPAPAAEAESFEGGGGYASGVSSQPGENSNRPADYKNLSPIKRVQKKDVVGQIAMLVGVVGILAAAAVIAMSFMMKAP